MIRFVRRTVRFSEEEDARYHKAAERAGVDFSSWVREACNQHERGPGPREVVERGPGPRGHAAGCPCSACTTATVANVSGDHKEE